ncbi:MAG: VWA domain-containing protein [Gammaproteobacteria bacterium]|nr:VWA domain-containing protein [Gammaproteobacteria bacterium]
MNLSFLTVRRAILWSLLLAASILIHGWSASRVGSEIKASTDALEAQRAAAAAKGKQVVIEIPADVKEAPPPEQKETELDEPLDFEEDFELEPPEVLIAPQGVAPLPPDVMLSLKAQAGGAGEDESPVEIAIATPSVSVAGLIKRTNIPTVGILSPTRTTGGTGGGSGGGTAGFGVGIGNALGGSTNQFAAYIAGMRESGLDVVFVVDATGTMGWVIDEVKDRLRDISTVIRSLVPIARFGVVAFRDKESGFVTRDQPLTYSTLKVQRFIDDLRAEGGGDIYEAVDEGLRVAIEGSDWRLGARRIIILIGDYPPADEEMDGIVRDVRRFSSSGGVVSALDVSDQSNPAVVEAKVGRKVDRRMYRSDSMLNYRIIADAGGGDSATLEGEVTITRRLITLIMGEQFAREMSALLELI